MEFAEIEACQAAGEWDRAGEILAGAAAKLAGAGADFLLICTNTMHKVADQVAAAIPIPLVHIAQVTADALEARGITTVGLLGTRYTMEQAFYREKLEERGIRVLVPQAPGRELVNRVIFQELCLGQVRAESRQAFLREMDALAAQGAQGVILGCTEIGMLVSQADTAIPLFDTTRLHAQRAVELALAD